MSEIHYIFRDGQTYAIKEGKVIAAGADSDEVERQVKQAFDPSVVGPHMMDPMDAVGAHACSRCGGHLDHEGRCVDCGMYPDEAAQYERGDMYDPYPHDEPSPGYELGGEAGSYMAHVLTPNGLKGTILGKAAGLWGEEVTIRLENGRIVKLPVGTELKQAKTAAKRDPIDPLEARLAKTPDGTRESLVARYEELGTIKQHAASMVRQASLDDQQRLDRIVVTADVEQREIKEAVAHLDDVESYAPPGFSMGVAHEAAGISRDDASWLDRVVDDMIKEAEATDFTKLMDEGPEALTAGLEDPALADKDVTHQIASSFILEKTAGIDRKIAEPYIDTFLGRIEDCRMNELARRQEDTTHNQKEAATEDPYKDVPDDAIFLS